MVGVSLTELRRDAPPDPSSECPVAARLSFEEVYAEHFQFVWRSLRALGVRSSHAEDVAQDVFVVVHRRLPDFSGEDYVRTWLFAIAMRVASDHRRRSRTFEDLSVADAVLDKGPSPLDVTVHNETVQLLERALERMDEHHRLVFFLMDVEELRASEVSAILSINVNTVYSRLHRARERFNEIVAELGAARSSKGKP
ncbi:MAG: polymerase sigma factor RpoE [Labilithrix sp.]|nr:polymerase sigma factor RpoE [Labilithrix sp.]